MFNIVPLSSLHQIDEDDLDQSSLAVIDAIKSGINSFSCKKSPYHEDFLKSKAENYSIHNTSRTYLMVNLDALYDCIDSGNGADQIIGAFFTIGISSISLVDEKISSKKRKKLKTHMFPRDNTLGCYVIGELCRSDSIDNSVLPGPEILDACLGVIKNAQDLVGGRIVLVDSRRKLFDFLYSKRDFKEIKMADSNTFDGEPLLTAALSL